jgi:peroxiredoxin family protein
MNMPVPTLAASLPGFQGMATAMMEKTVKAKGVPSIKELRDICVESEVRLVACQMTVDLFSYRQDEFIPEIAEWIGATSYLAEARSADVCLFI